MLNTVRFAMAVPSLSTRLSRFVECELVFTELVKACGRDLQTLYKHGGTVTAVMVYNTYLLSASTDRTVRLWQASAGRQQLLYPAFEQVRVNTTVTLRLHFTIRILTCTHLGILTCILTCILTWDCFEIQPVYILLIKYLELGTTTQSVLLGHGQRHGHDSYVIVCTPPAPSTRRRELQGRQSALEALALCCTLTVNLRYGRR